MVYSTWKKDLKYQNGVSDQGFENDKVLRSFGRNDVKEAEKIGCSLRSDFVLPHL